MDNEVHSEAIRITMKHFYMFDVDHTLNTTGGKGGDGPVPIEFLRILRENGYYVGICGNWAHFVNNVKDWDKIVCCIGPMEMTKVQMLNQVKTYIKADRYIMIGNEGKNGQSQDKASAIASNWEFVKEDNYLILALSL